MRGWRPLLRFAWRDVRRSKGRSALVLVMIALPVLAVTVAATVLATSDMEGVESLERRLGAADARIVVEPGITEVTQGPDPDWSHSADGSGEDDPLTPEDVGTVLDRDVRLIEMSSQETKVDTEGGAARAVVHELDLRDPLAEGFATLEEGRWPKAPGEAFVNEALAEEGPGLGEVVRLQDGTGLVVVGVGRDANQRSVPVVYAPPGSVSPPDASRQTPSTTWLVDAGGPVTWEEVRALNERGAFVLSRAVMEDPPSESELPAEVRGSSSGGGVELTVAVLVITMVLLEVVLLAGPAFAVTVRRQSRNLALMAATGGTPGQARLAVLSIALVLGGIAVALGLGLGLLLARAVGVPAAQLLSPSWFGPFDVPWLALLVVGVFGLIAPVLAAVAPAWLASRMDVVAVLAGRRGEGRPSRRSPVVGLVLLGAGIALAVYGARKLSYGELPIAAAAILSVLGMVLLVPVVVAALARVGGRLPLSARYAVRDAARHRSRTAPAIAAVAATVAGVVALGISTSSDAEESRVTYTPELAHGTALVQGGSELRPDEWARLRGIVAREAPEAEVTDVHGVLTESDDSWLELTYREPGTTREPLLAWSGGSLGTQDLVAEEVPDALFGLDEESRAAADRALAQGRVVVLTAREVAADQVEVRAKRWDHEGESSEAVVRPTLLPAAYVTLREGDGGAAVRAILPPAVAEDLGLETATTALFVSGEIPEEADERLEEAVLGVTPTAWFYIERGYQGDEANLIVNLVLGSLGGLLMLGGTLTATFLALNDARPDLATLAAVGAPSRVRRSVAASYALVVGGVGAVLGALVGFVPGIAVAFPLTTTSGVWSGSGSFTVNDVPAQTGPFIDVPWLLIGAVVVGLPLLTAAVVGLSARSRLPMVARVE